MAYSYVKTGLNSGNAATVTFSPTNVGDLLIVGSATSAGGGSPTASITDNLSDTWSTALATHVDSSTGQFISCFFLPNCPAGITTITLTFSGGTPGTTDIFCTEYSGIATTSPLNAGPGANYQTNPGTGANAVTSASITVSQQPALLFGCFYDSNFPTMTAGTGFTRRQSSGSNGWMTEDQRLTATGSYAATATDPAGASAWTTSIALAFLEPSGGGGGPQPLLMMNRRNVLYTI